MCRFANDLFARESHSTTRHNAQNQIAYSWRRAIVEPVISTLVNFLGMRKVNTRGIKLANKCVTT